MAMLLTVSAQAQMGGKAAMLPLTGQSTLVNSFRVDVALRDAMDELKQFSLESKEATTELLQTAQQLGLSCTEGDVGCYAKIGLLADLKWMVFPLLVDADGHARLRLILMDVGANRVVVQVDRDITPDATLLTRYAVYQLLGQTGSLVISTEPTGAHISIDGVERGTTPLPGPIAVAIGTHKVQAKLNGFETVYREIQSDLDTSIPVPMTLKANAADDGLGGGTKNAAASEGMTEGLPPLVLYSAAGATAVVAVVALLSAATALVNESTLRNLTKSTPDRKDAKARAQISWLVAISAGGLTVAGGVASGVLFTVTDFGE